MAQWLYWSLRLWALYRLRVFCYRLFEHNWFYIKFNSINWLIFNILKPLYVFLLRYCLNKQTAGTDFVFFVTISLTTMGSI